MSKYPDLKVDLLTYTQNPEWVVAVAARLCYSPLEGESLKESMTAEKVEKLIASILAMKHFSVLEHAVFSFLIEGVSRVTTHQLVRHRIGCSYSQKSQRYVKEKEPNFIIPPVIAQDQKAKEKFLSACRESHQRYNELVELGIHREAARYLLPQSIESKLVVTMSARALHHFFSLRCCHRSQDEIRSLAIKMRSLVRKVAPNLFASAGASCETTGVCSEGDFSCGRYKTFKKRRNNNG